MLGVWWNSKGVVHYEVLNTGQTVNADPYSQQLTRVDYSLRRPGVDTATTKLFHDYARPHVAKLVHKKIGELGWTVLPHPLYSPDIPPSEYHLFRSMQHALGEQKFGNIDAVKIWVDNFFKSRSAEFYHDVHSLRARWKSAVDNCGEYICSCHYL